MKTKPFSLPSMTIRAAASVLTLLAASVLPGMAQAVEFRSVGTAPAILYDAPSDRGKKVFVAPRGMPVEVVLTYGEWLKVRDAAGDLAWMQSKALTNKRTVVTSAGGVKVRASASDTAPVVLTADKGVLFDLAEAPASGWLKVKHRDGETGFVKVGDVWGE